MSASKQDGASPQKKALFPKFQKKISGFISDESGKIANDDIQKILLSTIAITGIIGAMAIPQMAAGSDDADDCDDDGDDCDDDDGDDSHSSCSSSYPHSNVAAVNTNHPAHCNTGGGHANVPNFAAHNNGPTNGHYSNTITNPASTQTVPPVNATFPYGAHCNVAGGHANVPNFAAHNSGLINGHYNQSITNPGASQTVPPVNATVYGSHTNIAHTNTTTHSNICS